MWGDNLVFSFYFLGKTYRTASERMLKCPPPSWRQKCTICSASGSMLATVCTILSLIYVLRWRVWLHHPTLRCHYSAFAAFWNILRLSEKSEKQRYLFMPLQKHIKCYLIFWEWFWSPKYHLWHIHNRKTVGRSQSASRKSYRPWKTMSWQGFGPKRRSKQDPATCTEGRDNLSHERVDAVLRKQYFPPALEHTQAISGREPTQPSSYRRITSTWHC
jgi:hypothetical protein